MGPRDTEMKAGELQPSGVESPPGDMNWSRIDHVIAHKFPKPLLAILIAPA